MLTISDKAHEMLLHYSAQADEGVAMALRIEIVGRGPKGFQYDLQFVSNEESKEDDVTQEIIDRDNCHYCFPGAERRAGKGRRYKGDCGEGPVINEASSPQAGGEKG